LLHRRDVPDILLYDINRNYNITNFAIIDRIKKIYVDISDVVIDLHQGWDYAVINDKSIGSGIYTDTPELKIEIIPKILNIINNPRSE
jgi:hypothetical protein